MTTSPKWVPVGRFAEELPMKRTLLSVLAACTIAAVWTPLQAQGSGIKLF